MLQPAQKFNIQDWFKVINGDIHERNKAGTFPARDKKLSTVHWSTSTGEKFKGQLDNYCSNKCLDLSDVEEMMGIAIVLWS